MRAFLGELQKNLRGIWGRLDGGQRLVVGAVGLASLVGLLAMLWFAAQPSYVVAFTSDTPEDMREARRLLSQAGVPFVPDETGRSLLVDRDRYPLARNSIVAGGLESGDDGSLLGGSIIEDAATKHFKLDLAARNQAQQAIAALAGVRSATVAASRPRRSPFRDRDAETMPRATVALRLDPGVPFEAVARSAASLCASQLMVPMSNVDVVDAGTHQRWRYDPDREAGGGTSEFLAQQRALGEERTRLAQEALDALYPGKTLVTVGVELDPLWETRHERVLPPEPVVLSDHTTKESTTNQQPGGGGGDPSVVATATERGGATGAVPGQTTKGETRERKFLPDIGERRSGKLAPEIRRLTVALLYDRTLEQRQGFDKQELVAVVKSIVGYDDGRDGEAGFSSMAGEFAAEEPLLVAAEPGVLEAASEWAPLLGQVLGVALVLLFLRGLLRRSGGAAGAAGSQATAPRPGAPAEEHVPAEEQHRRMRREIERAIAADPAALARLLENWMTEQKS